MNESDMTLQILPSALMALAGLLLGLAYFHALGHSVRLFAGGKRWMPVLLTVGRLAAILALLLPAAMLGRLPLLAAFLGFLVARFIALRIWRGMA